MTMTQQMQRQQGQLEIKSQQSQLEMMEAQMQDMEAQEQQGGMEDQPMGGAPAPEGEDGEEAPPQEMEKTQDTENIKDAFFNKQRLSKSLDNYFGAWIRTHYDHEEPTEGCNHDHDASSD